MTLWVFGYGSLLWNPGFTPEESVLARLEGYHRSFCMLSVHHRGTEEEPGLVLALDLQEGASCTGLALKVRAEEEEQVLAYLRERELISSAYYETGVTLSLTDGREVPALAYVIDPEHRQYVQYDLERQARLIARARGGRGPNDEYLTNTASHLTELGIHDPDMDWLVARVRDISGSGGA
ncbi:gamma-glutamylcyclotransferase [Histidinibacterium aquaticum]|uniref:glutathione-specific gamma-glutamylcyclotransferase n=1 Tax=Histidinibacterium aquaticum TaxID=2613962 RepID=A0A5J5GJI6_9RHOB|nr:gamma-glutamylcyclotransferase [Histidinibacterium aquaticum]KAA9008277.1 gamma-glutamylcyclotransferase [Histidinibacterium aquaticum]